MFFHIFLWNSKGLGVSRRTAPTIRSYMQIFSRFGGTRCQKVHFSTFSGKLTFQSTRKWPSKPSILSRDSPGHLHYLFLDISPTYFSKTFRKKKTSRKSGNLKNRSWKVKVSSFVSAGTVGQKLKNRKCKKPYIKLVGDSCWSEISDK